jgi:S1-C subfamily serine protease
MSKKGDPMKLLTNALAALMLMTASAFAWDLEKMNETIDKTNVIVSRQCSGTIVDIEKKLVLTAHHCVTTNYHKETREEVNPETGEVQMKVYQVKDPMTIEIWKHQDYEVVSSQIYAADIVAMDYLHDIALLKVVDEDWKPTMAAPLAKDYKYIRGKTVFAVGNPAVQFDGSITQGIISAPERKLDLGKGRVPFFQFSAGVIGGNSGGALYNDDGEIIGTVSAGLRGASVNFGVPVKFAIEMIENYKKPKTTFTYTGPGSYGAGGFAP